MGYGFVQDLASLEKILEFAATQRVEKPKSERFTHKQRRERRQAMAKFSETHTNQETADHFGVTIPTVRLARKEAGFSAKLGRQAMVL